MGLREKVNQHQRWVVVAAVAACLVSAGWLVLSNRDLPERAPSAYYSDDGGKTYFADGTDRIYPFDHNGRQAYRAYVYRFGNGQPFVSYLARYAEGARKHLAELADKSGSPDALRELQVARASGIEVSKVGQTDWYPVNSSKGAEVTAHPVGSDGNRATPLSP